MAYDPNEMADLTQIHGDEDANKFSEIDPLGGAIFGWGNTAYNNEIARKNAQLAALKAQLGGQKLSTVENAVSGNAADWANLGTNIFGPSGTGLSDFYSGVEGKDQSNLQDLLGALKSYQNPADYFKDPNFMGDVGDVTNAAVPSAGTLANQQGALQQFKNLSVPQETAQEKLIRMMANREMESNLAGDREALARSLKARGVYGSGAELVGNLMSQGQEADRAALSNAQANAQASQRALSALGSYSDLAAKMRASETGEGTLANQVAEFNNAANQSNVMQRGAAQLQATQQGEAAKAQRAAQGFTAGSNVNNAQRQDKQNQINTQMGFTQGETGSRTQGAGMLSDALGGQQQDITNAIAANEAKRKTSLLGLG